MKWTESTILAVTFAIIADSFGVGTACAAMYSDNPSPGIVGWAAGLIACGGLTTALALKFIKEEESRL